MALKTRIKLGSVQGKPRTLTGRAVGNAPSSIMWANKSITYPLYGNDTLPDCGPAAIGHMEQVWNHVNSGYAVPSPSGVTTVGVRRYTVSGTDGSYIPIQPDITTWLEQFIGRGISNAKANLVSDWWTSNYEQIVATTSGAYIPTMNDVMRVFNGTPPMKDGGRRNADILNYVTNRGLAGGQHKVFWSKWDVTQDRVQEAIWKLGGGYIVSYGLPISAQTQRAWRKTQNNDAKGSWGYHTVNLCGYNAHGPIAISWGRITPMSWQFHNEYADGVGAACLGWDWCPGQVSPLGDKWEDLAKAFGI